jgi:hypothetical protein
MHAAAAICEGIMRDTLERDDVARAIEQEGAVTIDYKSLAFESGGDKYVLALVHVDALLRDHSVMPNGAPSVIPLDLDLAK